MKHKPSQTANIIFSYSSFWISNGSKILGQVKILDNKNFEQYNFHTSNLSKNATVQNFWELFISQKIMQQG